MNCLSHHLLGDISPEYQRRCLARNVARWNAPRRDAWLVTHWKPKYGAKSTRALALEIIEARVQLNIEREAQRQQDRKVGKAALAALRATA